MTKTQLLTNFGIGCLALTMALRFLLGQLYGVFILCISVYIFCDDIFGFKPFTPLQLLEWFNIQSEGTKNTILGALITVIGFMVAYASTSQNWKNQELVKLKLKAAEEIESHVAICGDLIIKTNIYALWLIDSHKKLRENYEYNEACFIVDYNKMMAQKFNANRDEFIAHAQAIHQLKARHFSLLSLIGRLEGELDIVINRIMEISEKIWFNAPISVATEKNEEIKDFYFQVDAEKTNEFIKAVENGSEQISGLAGSICGALRYEVIGFNFSSLKNLYKKRRGIEEFLKIRAIK